MQKFYSILDANFGSPGSGSVFPKTDPDPENPIQYGSGSRMPKQYGSAWIQNTASRSHGRSKIED